MPAPVLILPGYGDSSPAHWQSLWQAMHPEFIRVVQRDWDAPSRGEWVEQLDAAVASAGPKTILVAHSLGCLLVAHWAATSEQRVAGALLVAPPDPLAAAFPSAIAGFSPLPRKRLLFPSILVSSSDDPYASPAFTKQCAIAWGSRPIDIGAAGHINATSSLGVWPLGQMLLTQLCTASAGAL